MFIFRRYFWKKNNGEERNRSELPGGLISLNILCDNDGTSDASIFLSFSLGIFKTEVKSIVQFVMVLIRKYCFLEKQTCATKIFDLN